MSQLRRRLHRVDDSAPDRLGAGLTFLASLIVLLALTPRITARLDPVTGDEPFYLMTATSLVDDGDLNEENNYARRDYRRFYPPEPLPATWRGWPSYPDPLPPHPTAATRPGLYSKHGLGLTLLVALPYAVAGRVGAVVMLNVVAALLAANVWLCARRELGYRGAFALMGLMIFSLPLLPYAFLIFPELPAALLVVYVGRRIVSERNAAWQWALSGSALGFLPWLHTRFLPISLTAALLAFLLHRPSFHARRTALAFATPPLVSAMLYLWFLIWLYGKPAIPVGDHAGFHGLSGSVNAAAGLMLDAQWGLLIYAPLYALALATALIGLARFRHDIVAVVTLVTPYLGLVAAYRVWWGEWGPPARYLVPVVPLLVVPVAWWLSRAGRPGWVVLAVIGLAGVPATVVGMLDPQRLYHHPDGQSRIYGQIAEWTGVPIDGALIAFQPYAIAPAGDRLAWVLGCVVVMLALALVVRRLARPSHGTRIEAQTGMPVYEVPPH